MKAKLNLARAWLLCALALGLGTPSRLTAAAADTSDTAKTSIPWSQIGAKAGGDYQGDGLAVIPTAEGARLCCVFQRLEGEATREGLWLTSTVTNAANDRFRVVATEVGRAGDSERGQPCPREQKLGNSRTKLSALLSLPAVGTVQVADKLVRFLRPGLTEEYTVSMDGVRQDFVVLEKPTGVGELAVRLAVNGAKLEPAAGGAQLVLENSGRKIAYSRLRVTDATGKELPARMEVASGILPDVEGGHPAARNLAADFARASLPDTIESAGLEAPALRQAGMPAATMLVVLVNDADAVYPVRIDPTFSDANWISMGGIPGADGEVYAAVVDGSGNLYIGGWFIVVGDVIANYIAKWDGSSWSALGSGMDNEVDALAVSGTDVYAGGYFTVAGGTEAHRVAKWNGSSWSALGSGMDYAVFALEVSESDLYAGGDFTMADNHAVNYIAKWDGSSWSALGLGMNGLVDALAVSGSNLYASGQFTAATNTGGTNVVANRVAKWNGSSWSALGSGMAGLFDEVRALAVSGSNLYAGGGFSTAGGQATSNIAKWDGSNWTAVGSGMNDTVLALAVFGSDLYAGGVFKTADGNAADRIAKWNGSSWSALGSGMNGSALALAVSGSNLYAGGKFATAGGKVSAYIARAYLPPLPALSVLRAGTDVTVSWPSVDTDGFDLEQADSLVGPPGWVPNTASVTDDSTNKSVTLPATNSSQLFRLRGP